MPCFDTARKKLTDDVRDETPKIASATSHALVDAIHIMEKEKGLIQFAPLFS